MKMQWLTVIDPDGVESTQAFDGEPELEVLQKAVDGYIRWVPHFSMYKGQPVVAVYVNEDGRENFGAGGPLPFNRFASHLWAEQHGQDWKTNDRARLYGNIAIIQNLPDGATDGGHKPPFS